MAAAPIPQQAIPVSSAGGISVAPPTFLEVNGVIFLSFAGGWVLIVSACLVTYYLNHLPPAPAASGAPGDLKQALEFHKTTLDQYRDSINFVYDLTVTKTILPVITLLLGYLFGKSKGS